MNFEAGSLDGRQSDFGVCVYVREREWVTEAILDEDVV